MGEDRYKKLFGYINLVEPPKGLGMRILAKISDEEKHSAKIKTWVFGGSTAISFVLSLWAVTNLAGGIKETGFWQYLSLIFSENGMVLAYWRELSFSLIESLPIVGLILFLTATGFFVWSLANVLRKDSRKFIMSFN